MATRLYLWRTLAGPPNQNSGYVGWEDTTSVFPSYPITTTPGRDVLGMTTISFTDSDATDKDVLLREFYTYPLTAGQTITGGQALKAQVRCSQVALTNNLFLAFRVFILDSTGTVIRKSVLDVTRDATEAATSLTNRQFTATSNATNYTTVAGDRIVIEMGLGGDPDPGSDHDCSIRLGDTAASDLPEDDTDTSDLRPWFQFTDTLTFAPTLSAIPILHNNKLLLVEP